MNASLSPFPLPSLGGDRDKRGTRGALGLPVPSSSNLDVSQLIRPHSHHSSHYKGIHSSSCFLSFSRHSGRSLFFTVCWLYTFASHIESSIMSSGIFLVDLGCWGEKQTFLSPFCSASIIETFAAYCDPGKSKSERPRRKVNFRCFSIKLTRIDPARWGIVAFAWYTNLSRTEFVVLVSRIE